MAQPRTHQNGGLRAYVGPIGQGGISPPWLGAGTAPGEFGVGGRLMYDFGLMGDLLIEKLMQSVYAWMPGLGTPTALPLLGNDRVLVQAPGETNAAFELRLQTAFDTWKYAGNDTSVLRQVLTNFTPWLPCVRIVSNSGSWTWYEAGTSNYLTAPTNHYYAAGSWDWDATKNPLTIPISASITGASSASPIVITTANPHNFSTGDSVVVAGVLGNTAANGTWTITVVTPWTFSLNTSTWSSGAYTSGGTAVDQTGCPAWWRDWLIVFPGTSIVGGSITGASSANPVVITTSSAHGLSTGATVFVTGVGGNLIANGEWTATVTGTHTFTIPVSASGTYTTGGAVYYAPAATTLQVVTSPTATTGGVVGPGFDCGAIDPSTGNAYACGTGVGNTANFSCGFSVPPSFFQPIVQLISTWKQAAAWFPFVLFSFDPTVLNEWSTPGTEPAGAVDGPGSWNQWAVNVGGVMVPNLSPNVRFVAGAPDSP